MAHGRISGTVHGSIHGAKHNELVYGGGSGASMDDVTIDADSLKYVPSSSDEWLTTLAVAGLPLNGPTYGWDCQEASGNLSSFLTAATLTKFGGATYQTDITGWDRDALSIGTGSAFYNLSIGNTSTTSYMWLIYARIPSTPAGADLALNVGGGSDIRSAGVNTTPAYRAQGNGVVAVEGASAIGTAVRPVVLLFNRATSEFSVLTDQEKITTVWVNPTSGASSYISLGDGVSIDVLYAALFQSDAAELSRAQVKSLLETLGWTIAWSP